MDFVKSRFCSIHFTLLLAGQKKIVRYIEDFVIQRFVISRFHCINRNTRQLIHQKRKQKKKTSLEYPNPRNMLERPQNRHAKQSICALLQPKQKHKHNPVSDASIKAHVTQKQVSKTSHQTHTEQKHVQVDLVNLNADQGVNRVNANTIRSKNKHCFHFINDKIKTPSNKSPLGSRNKFRHCKRCKMPLTLLNTLPASNVLFVTG